MGAKLVTKESHVCKCLGKQHNCRENYLEENLRSAAFAVNEFRERLEEKQVEVIRFLLNFSVEAEYVVDISIVNDYTLHNNVVEIHHLSESLISLWLNSRNDDEHDEKAKLNSQRS